MNRSNVCPACKKPFTLEHSKDAARNWSGYICLTEGCKYFSDENTDIDRAEKMDHIRTTMTAAREECLKPFLIDAEHAVGELMRKGETVYYAHIGGMYEESTNRAAVVRKVADVALAVLMDEWRRKSGIGESTVLSGRMRP